MARATMLSTSVQAAPRTACCAIDIARPLPAPAPSPILVVEMKSRHRSMWVVLAAWAALSAPRPSRADNPEAAGGTYYVASNGFDDSKSGSSAHPFASITFAAGQVPDGSTILVRPGMYKGRVSLGRQHVKGVVIRSEEPYRAMLRNHDEKVIRCWACAGVT